MSHFFCGIRRNNNCNSRLQSVCNVKAAGQYSYHLLILCYTVLLAVAIPRLELFISLFGALCLSALGIAFPSTVELCLLWPTKSYGRLYWILAKDILLIVCGIVGLIIGTYVSIANIVVSFQ